MKRFSLRFQFLLMLIVLMMVVFASITYTIVNQASTTLRKNLIKDSESFAALATQPIGNAFVTYQQSGTLHIDEEVSSFTSLDNHIDQVEVVNTNGQILYNSNPSSIIQLNNDEAGSISAVYLYDKSHNLSSIVQPYVEQYGIHQYTIVYGISYQSVVDSIHSIIGYVVIVSIIILLLSVLLWYLVINQLFLRPVAYISHLAFKVSRGDLNQKIEVKRNDEIGELAEAVETMASSLKSDIVKLRQLDIMKNEFLMITSHNLRTPLTVIEGYIDTMAHLPLPDNIKQMIEPITVNITRLREFAEDVLTISTIEAGNYVMQFQKTSMEPILTKIADEFSKLAKQKKIIFTSDIKVLGQVDLSKTQFRSALWNLLDNAYKFTPENGRISLIASEVNSFVSISIIDSGPGIAPEELPRLFTKFHRATDTLKYNYEGTGIGLYLSKLIIEQHRGNIKVSSQLTKGSTFTIEVPLARSPD